MRIIKLSFVLLLCMIWIFVTNYKYFPINSIGSLLSFKSGVIGIDNNEDITSLKLYNKDLEIKVDSFGIPYIYAKNNEDVAFGLGYMHAKDRYFQMELMAKLVQGELSEMIGVRGIRSDKLWKPYEFKRKSQEILEEYKRQSTDVYTYLNSYALGINTYLKENKINDPLYTIFGLEPQPWKPEYSILATWYMSRNLAYFDYHVERQELLDKLPQELLHILYPKSPKDLKTILSSQIDTTQIHEQPVTNVSVNSKAKSSPFVTGIGSNNWVVNSKKSKGDAALIANDPHMRLTFPASFYEVGLHGGQIQVYGYSIPGTPLVVSGHNEKIAWGITNGEWDMTDRYLLQTEKDSLYFYRGNWIPFEEKEYHIDVRGRSKITFKVQKTVHGFVKKEGDVSYAQYWHPEQKSHSIGAVYNAMRANNWKDFTTALKDYDYPPQNFIYADIYDTIGIITAGKLPIRPQGFEGGLLDGTKEPLKLEFSNQLVYEENPTSNYLFSANQQPIQNDKYYGAHWHKNDYRVNRIDRILQENDNWNLSSMKEMQLDEVDISYYHAKEVFKEVTFDKKYQYIMDVFEDWNADMTYDSRNAFIYDIFRQHVEKESKEYANSVLHVRQAPSMKSFLNYINAGVGNKQPKKEQLLSRILIRTDSMILAKKNLESIEKYKNGFFVFNASFLPGFGKKMPFQGGNKNTISLNEGVANPVFRSVYEMKKNNIKGYSILAGGQSGKMNSPNYEDQLLHWEKGKFKETQFSKDPNQLKNIMYTIRSK
ncbi:acyl-homoserine lactone acylase QuiP [Kordia sp. SMS9]|uniref:penicillin acylase family protein n=1 Tax=Kordia sp. SMS9 TaxID=2282170 RepID=UPI000E0DB914|nr:penicillin acylase family protein [Kordia sp. SMS9]AXG70231.1 acyl-homoserine lactone acylase QuiP [Kordia sp. SMS9]